MKHLYIALLPFVLILLTAFNGAEAKAKTGLLSPTEYRLLSQRKKSQYIKALQKVIYNFEIRYEKHVGQKYSLSHWLIPEAYGMNKDTWCVVGGLARTKTGGKCPTGGRSCDNKPGTFMCGKIYNSICVSRDAENQSKLCYEKALKKNEIPSREAYREIAATIEKIRAKLCAEENEPTSPCGYLIQQIENVRKAHAPDVGTEPATEGGDQAEAAAEAVSNAATTPMPPLTKPSPPPPPQTPTAPPTDSDAPSMPTNKCIRVIDKNCVPGDAPTVTTLPKILIRNSSFSDHIAMTTNLCRSTKGTTFTITDKSGQRRLRIYTVDGSGQVCGEFYDADGDKLPGEFCGNQLNGSTLSSNQIIAQTFRSILIRNNQLLNSEGHRIADVSFKDNTLTIRSTTPNQSSLRVQFGKDSLVYESSSTSTEDFVPNGSLKIKPPRCGSCTAANLHPQMSLLISGQNWHYPAPDRQCDQVSLYIEPPANPQNNNQSQPHANQ